MLILLRCCSYLGAENELANRNPNRLNRPQRRNRRTGLQIQVYALADKPIRALCHVFTQRHMARIAAND